MVELVSAVKFLLVQIHFYSVVLLPFNVKCTSVSVSALLTDFVCNGCRPFFFTIQNMIV